MTTFPDRCFKARHSGERYPSLTAAEAGLSLDDAYRLQHEFVHQLLAQEEIYGYKAALTAPAAQQAMAIETPIVGVLFKSGEALPGKLVVQPGSLLETELGFTLGRSVETPVSAGNVLDYINQVAPMIELANPNLANKPSGLDLVATNSASYRFLRGSAFEPGLCALDKISTALLRDGEMVFSGRCGEIMAGQLDALCWLMNTVLDIGYPLLAGHTLMTGSVGGMAPARPGAYIGRFADGISSDISFTIAE